MSNLIPERRTNKNGVTSTKWVRPSLPKEPISAAIPMPTASARTHQWVDLQREVIEVSGLLHTENSTDRIQRMVRSNLTYIGEHDSGMLARMKKIASEHEAAFFLLRNLLTRNGSYATTGSELNLEREMRRLNNALHLIPLCTRLEDQFSSDAFDSGGDGNRLIDSVNRVLNEGGVAGLDEAHTVALGMITFIQGDFDMFTTGESDLSYDEVEAEVDYIANHLSETEPLLPELKARKAFDRGTIEILRNAPAKSISSGLL